MEKLCNFGDCLILFLNCPLFPCEVQGELDVAAVFISFIFTISKKSLISNSL